MSLNAKLIDELSYIIHTKYNDIVSEEYIKKAIPMHIDSFFKSVTKTALYMEPDVSLSVSSNESSAEMWMSLSQSQIVRSNNTI